jgi:hypothetical protein
LTYLILGYFLVTNERGTSGTGQQGNLYWLWLNREAGFEIG